MEVVKHNVKWAKIKKQTSRVTMDGKDAGWPFDLDPQKNPTNLRKVYKKKSNTIF